ncbi:hydroxyethylthiazole kinase [Limoniibacter endophyticus]|uniref:Hydroxyethylthiazole kinase n=1 Tax=Limoniibacter endophyticus TaxID=1565040 RepID=A0A8J3GGW2_9HYPH|nr:hydroxyethylthiazole kinase [Limoniibacter endophyticus]GHC67563.1 hydroxyethylthiazole kinase [Limoniibacter endophyticus]
MTNQTRDNVSALVSRMRDRKPLVHCITNYVAMNISANVLLAIGASPAMIHAPEEAGEFASIADALLVNIGTVSPHWFNGMSVAAKAANAAGKPWVFDPVAHFATAYRREATAQLMTLAPTIIRGNASEIIALAGASGGGRGVDSGDSVEQAKEAARTLARRYCTVISVSGEHDFVTDGKREAIIIGGSAWMPSVTALGCSLSATTAAFAAIAEKNFFCAAIAALACFAEAGEKAAERAEGAGTFAIAFLDALSTLDSSAPAQRIASS